MCRSSQFLPEALFHPGDRHVAVQADPEGYRNDQADRQIHEKFFLGHASPLAVPDRVTQSCRAKTRQPNLTAVAAPAGLAGRRWIITTVRQMEWDRQRGTQLDDLAF